MHNRSFAEYISTKSDAKQICGEEIPHFGVTRSGFNNAVWAFTIWNTCSFSYR